jgi:hypothetical protein
MIHFEVVDLMLAVSSKYLKERIISGTKIDTDYTHE